MLFSLKSNPTDLQSKERGNPLTQFPASLIYCIYYRKEDEIFRIEEKGIWSEISLKQLENQIKNHILKDEKYMIVYEHHVLNKKDFWMAYPKKINQDELGFWHSYGLLSEEEYLCLINMS